VDHQLYRIASAVEFVWWCCLFEVWWWWCDQNVAAWQAIGR
jgi:hypothetical protein